MINMSLSQNLIILKKSITPIIQQITTVTQDVWLINRTDSNINKKLFSGYKLTTLQHSCR
jgi:hypothetical protein